MKKSDFVLLGKSFAKTSIALANSQSTTAIRECMIDLNEALVSSGYSDQQILLISESYNSAIEAHEQSLKSPHQVAYENHSKDALG
ncbi:hypothetical protein [Vibrio sp. R78045]|uniref:hypothetical protein n=1 Tax=Vibrio sp. R78045 TaxID=3093868 RepID=UPI0036F3242B